MYLLTNRRLFLCSVGFRINVDFDKEKGNNVLED